MRDFLLPREFLLGAATSATQIEGGETRHTWYRWSNMPGKISDGTTSFRACDHWNRIDEDIGLIRRLGLHTYRLGLEWSRLEPMPGEYDGEALAVYRREIQLLIEAGVKPLVTIYHFVHPLWFEDSGGWLRGDAAEVFQGLVRFVVEGLGDLVSDWITVNEPNIYLLQGFIFGIWPPGYSSLGRYFKGRKQFVPAHNRAYDLIHRIRDQKGWNAGAPTKVGVAHHLRIYDPYHRWNPIAALIAKILDRLTHDIFVNPMTRSGGAPKADFLGINYYTRDHIKLSFNPGTIFSKQVVPEGRPVNNLGWEIYPDGLRRLCVKMYKRHKLPIWITENGTCDAQDDFRSAYILDHLKVVAELIAQGIPVERYYHWSLMDNFEWAEGEIARFGLYRVDFETQKRTMRPSGGLYARICKERMYREESE